QRRQGPGHGQGNRGTRPPETHPLERGRSRGGSQSTVRRRIEGGLAAESGRGGQGEDRAGEEVAKEGVAPASHGAESSHPTGATPSNCTQSQVSDRSPPWPSGSSSRNPPATASTSSKRTAAPPGTASPTPPR